MRHGPPDAQPAPRRDTQAGPSASTGDRPTPSHPLGTGTGLRFALLLVLVAAASVAMTSDHIVLRRILGDPGNDQLGCQLAAGFDPQAGFLENVGVFSGRNAAAFNVCAAPYEQSAWAPLAVVAGVFALAAALCWVMPLWKLRRRGLRAVEPSSDEETALRQLVAEAEVPAIPAGRFLVDWASMSTNAVAFGRPGRVHVALSAGLLHTRTSNPDRFKATVLHELAHLQYRDVSLTYATVALWRVFAVTMLLPYLARFIELFVEVQFFLTDAVTAIYTVGEGPRYLRSVVLCLFMVVLVYLSRSDILRNRELYADRWAFDHGAKREVWEAAERADADAHAQRKRHAARAALDTLLADHPSWAHRAQALRNPKLLVDAPAVPTFLTGAAAATVAGYLHYPPAVTVGGWLGPVGAILAGTLIASTIGLTLWRRTAHALDDDRMPSSGSRTGVWLGLGLAVGSFLADTGAEAGAGLAPVPALTVLLVPIGYLLTCWTTYCARLFLASAPPHETRKFTTVGLVSTALLFAFWLDWCESSDLLFQPDLLAVLQQHTAQLYGFADPSAPAVRAVMLTVIITASFGPLLAPSRRWSRRRSAATSANVTVARPADTAAGTARGTSRGAGLLVGDGRGQVPDVPRGVARLHRAQRRPQQLFTVARRVALLLGVAVAVDPSPGGGGRRQRVDQLVAHRAGPVQNLLPRRHRVVLGLAGLPPCLTVDPARLDR